MTNSIASPLLRGSFIHIALPAPLYTSAPSTEPGSVLTQDSRFNRLPLAGGNKARPGSSLTGFS